jgi:hypothetical protein
MKGGFCSITTIAALYTSATGNNNVDNISMFSISARCLESYTEAI